jgi:LysM repeat protein/uncharacterized protein YvpB
MALKPFLRSVFIAACFIPLTVQALDLPEAASVSGISGHPQSLPLDCESRSAADWAGFWGVYMDEVTFFNQLPKTDNPNTGFVGSVYDSPGYLPPRGYGVYTGPVATLLKEVYGLPAEARHYLTEFELRSEIASARPVIVWYIYGFRVMTAYDLSSSDGSVYRAASFEHTGIVLGYDSASYTVLDAYTGWAQRVDRSQFLNSWAVLGNMAVTGSGYNLDPLMASASVPAAGSGNSGVPTYYVVQSGDTLSGIAARFNLDWTEIAALNGLSAPYTIYPGQQLLLPGGAAPSPAAPETTPTPGTSLTVPSTYVVQKGDTLSSIAQVFGLYWPDIAAANGITWPYTIYPGQTLILPER